jgi:ADP-ribose pyrophosphatase
MPNRVSPAHADPNGFRTLYHGRFLSLVARGTWEYASRTKVSGVVGIVAITPDGKLVLIEQHRKPVQASVIELPAGLAGDVAGQELEELATAAKRELLEETGYEARSMKPLMTGASSAGLTDEQVVLFQATGLKRVGDGGGDGSEDITVHLVPVDRVAAFCRKQANAGKLLDFKIFAGLYLASANGVRRDAKGGRAKAAAKPRADRGGRS